MPLEARYDERPIYSPPLSVNNAIMLVLKKISTRDLNCGKRVLTSDFRLSGYNQIYLE